MLVYTYVSGHNKVALYVEMTGDIMRALYVFITVVAEQYKNVQRSDNGFDRFQHYPTIIEVKHR